MTSKEIQQKIIELENQIEQFGEMITLTNQLSILKSYKQDLERLEALKNKNAALKIKVRAWEIQSDKYKQEIEQLKKAIEKASKILSWDCPCSQDLTDDLDCENRCQPDIDYAECWKKYFLKEVLGE
jgi:tetratricopeptide (TPR) repeat protein